MTLEVRVAGADITVDVVIKGAVFTMANGPNPGDFTFQVKDPDKVYAFRAGNAIEADFDGVRIFEGFVFQAIESFAFPVVETDVPAEVVKMWTLKGPDLNILFRKRFLFDQSDPKTPFAQVPPGTSDLTYLSLIMSRLTAGDDDLTTDFHHVGSPEPDLPGLPGSIGDSWERAMTLTANLPGAVWGMRPDRTVYYEDDDTITAPFAISDEPDDVTSFGYSNFRWIEDGSQIVNDSRIWGVGLGKSSLTYAHFTDEDSIAEHGRWPNGDGWRYNLYLQPSVNAVAHSLIDGSPQHLHGAKDPSLLVKCRVRRPGLTPGDKVRIISTVYGEDIVLPIRRLTTTFVDIDSALFDLEASWDIDQPLSIFDYPDLPTDSQPPDDTTSETCGDDFNFALGWIDSTFDWQVVRNHPWLGSSSFVGNLISFRSKKRYNETLGNIFVADLGDGVAGSTMYWYGRHPTPATMGELPWVIQIDFEVPYYSMVNGFHLDTFPRFEAGFWWGDQNNDIIPTIQFGIMVNGSAMMLVSCSGGVNTVIGSTDNQPQGSRWHFERYSNGKISVWQHGGNRPAPFSAGTPFNFFTDEPWYEDDYGPNRPWPDFNANPNYIYLLAQARGFAGGKSANPGNVGGNPNATNSDIRNTFLNFTTGPTVTGNVSGYHEGLKDGYRVSIPVNDFRLITLPDPFNFTTDTPPLCDDLVGEPVPGSQLCELIKQATPTTYNTTHSFATGSTVVSLEGLEQRLGFDYDELEGSSIVFKRDIPSAAQLYVCYMALGSGGAVVPPVGGYTFFDDFDTLNTSVWAKHFSVPDATETTFDITHATASGSILTLQATRTSPLNWVSALIDTKTSFSQRYGLFEARIKIPRGRGLWPAFWGYYSSGGVEQELDMMEVYASAIGAFASGHTVADLHTTVHDWSGGVSQQRTPPYSMAGDLSLDYHVYGMDWRPTYVAFLLDGAEVWRYVDAAHIPSVALPLILNLAVSSTGGGPSDGTTPSPSNMLVDWVRVSA